MTLQVKSYKALNNEVIIINYLKNCNKNWLGFILIYIIYNLNLFNIN